MIRDWETAKRVELAFLLGMCKYWAIVAHGQLNQTDVCIASFISLEIKDSSLCGVNKSSGGAESKK